MTDEGESYKEGLKRRLLEGLEGRPLTWLERRTGDSYKNLQRWVGGSTLPPPDFIARYLRALPSISPAWLLLEEGPMHRTPATREQQGFDAVRRVVQAFDALDKVPVVDISFYEPEPRPGENGEKG